MLLKIASRFCLPHAWLFRSFGRYPVQIWVRDCFQFTWGLFEFRLTCCQCDALGIEELEREVAQLLQRIPANLEIDSDPEPNDEQQPGTFATPGNSTGTSKWYTGNYPLYQRPPTCVQADLKRRGRDSRERQDRDKHLLAMWPRGKGPDKVRLLLEGLYLIPYYPHTPA